MWGVNGTLLWQQLSRLQRRRWRKGKSGFKQHTLLLSPSIQPLMDHTHTNTHLHSQLTLIHSDITGQEGKQIEAKTSQHLRCWGLGASGRGHQVLCVQNLFCSCTTVCLVLGLTSISSISILTATTCEKSTVGIWSVSHPSSLHFAYRHGRGTVDALNTTTHLVLKHLENNIAYARLLFMDCTSVLNTILPQMMTKKKRM